MLSKQDHVDRKTVNYVMTASSKYGVSFRSFIGNVIWLWLYWNDNHKLIEFYNGIILDFKINSNALTFVSDVKHLWSIKISPSLFCLVTSWRKVQN